MGKKTKQLTASMIRAREMLMILLTFLATGDAFHYTINGDTCHEYSLAKRLGFYHEIDYYAFLVHAGLAHYIDRSDGKQLMIVKNEWETMLSIHPDRAQLFQMSKKRFDIQSVIDNVNQNDNKKFDYHTIRIGIAKKDTVNNINEQIVATEGKGLPRMSSLGSMQRSLLRNTRRMIADTTLNDPDVFNDANNKLITVKVRVETTDDGTTEVIAEDTMMDDATSPRKRLRTDIGSAQPTPSPQVVANEKRGSSKREFSHVESAFNVKDTDEITEKELDALIAQCLTLKQQKSGNNGILSYQDPKGWKNKSYVQIPVTTTDETHVKYGEWIDKCLAINGRKDGIFKSAKRTAKYIYRKHTAAFTEALNDLKISTPNKMMPVHIAAMFKSANVKSRRDRRALMRHLRHHFGREFFAPENAVQMLCEGHTEVYQDTIQYAYEEGKAKETIDFQYKNAADETSAQLKRQLRSRGIKDLKDIDRIDFIIGADHGKGAFIVGAKIVVTLKQDSIHESFSFEISIAEIICRKDTAAVLKATIHDELTKGLKTIAENNINISLNDSNEIECCFSTQQVNEPATSLKATMYVVGDLAFYKRSK